MNSFISIIVLFVLL